MLVPWTPLAPSLRERRLRQFGAVLALATAVALAIAAAWSDPFGWSLAVFAVVVALAGLIVGRRPPATEFEVGIDLQGRLAIRPAGPPDSLAPTGTRCLFAAPWLITGSVGTMWVAIWPDSVPPATFRRLWVHIRWSAGRTGTEPSATAPRQPQ